MFACRKILHVDLDAFFCSVEELLDPNLKGTPFATGGSPEGRGVISSCSYAARKYGIHSAMPARQALGRLQTLNIVKGHYSEYQSRSESVMRIIENLTPLVEKISIDEAFLDVSDLPEASLRIAIDLQFAIYSKLNLPCSIGCATNKLVAKIATNVGKANHLKDSTPMAITVVNPGDEEEFLAPLPVIEMWGIGPKIAGVLNKLGVRTIGEIVAAPVENLKREFGNYALDLIKKAKGIDDHPVLDSETTKSVSNEITFGKDVFNRKELISTLKQLSEKVAERLRRKGLSGKTIKIKLRWPNFETLTRQITISQPTNQDSIIFSTVCELFDNEWNGRTPIRLVGVGVSQLFDELHQLSFFDDSYEREKQLLNAIDVLKERYGNDAVRKGFNPNEISYQKKSGF